MGLFTLLGPQSRLGDKSLGIKLVCPQIGTAVLKELTDLTVFGVELESHH